MNGGRGASGEFEGANANAVENNFISGNADNTATATDANGNTSEFSAPLPANS